MAQQRYVLSAEAVRDLFDLQSFLTEREGEERALTIIARLHRAMTSLSDYISPEKGVEATMRGQAMFNKFWR
jgi:plasmid stabilization system protein ParE